MWSLEKHSLIWEELIRGGIMDWKCNIGLYQRQKLICCSFNILPSKDLKGGGVSYLYVFVEMLKAVFFTSQGVLGMWDQALQKGKFRQTRYWMTKRKAVFLPNEMDS